MSDDRADEQSFIVISSDQLKRVNTAIDGRCSPALDHCLTNGLFGENGMHLLRITGLVDLGEEYFDATKDLCNVLINVDNLAEEFHLLYKTGNDKPV